MTTNDEDSGHFFRTCYVPTRAFEVLRLKDENSKESDMCIFYMFFPPFPEKKVVFFPKFCHLLDSSPVLSFSFVDCLPRSFVVARAADRTALPIRVVLCCHIRIPLSPLADANPSFSDYANKRKWRKDRRRAENNLDFFLAIFSVWQSIANS